MRIKSSHGQEKKRNKILESTTMSNKKKFEQSNKHLRLCKDWKRRV